MLNLPSNTTPIIRPGGNVFEQMRDLLEEHNVLINLISFRVGDAYNYQVYWKHLPSGEIQHLRTDVSSAQRPITVYESAWEALEDAVKDAVERLEL